jgi:hypothetical protein
MTNKQYDDLISKLDMIVKILSFQVLPEDSITERVRIFKSIGLTNTQISEVLNVSRDVVNTLSSRIKKLKNGK